MTDPQRDTSRWGRFRDNIAWKLCGWLLDHVATEWYRTMIQGSILYGLDAAKRDVTEGRELNR